MSDDRPKLEVFDVPPGLSRIEFRTADWHSVCPRTGQPDFGTLTIRFVPRRLAVESKSLKLWLQSWHGHAAFVEQLAVDIAAGLNQALHTPVEVTFVQAVRGGIEETVTANIG